MSRVYRDAKIQITGLIFMRDYEMAAAACSPVCGTASEADLLNRKKQDIKYVEELSLNAWPSHKIELYDGWLIRFSHNYTYRTNSVEQVGASTIPVEEKIAYCESVYRNFRTPANFKINPLLDVSFDRLLEQKGYAVKHITEVMTADMEHLCLYPEQSKEYEFENRLGLPSFVHYPDDLTVLLSPVITDEWIQGVFHLNGTCEPILRRTVPSMFKAIPKETIAAYIEIEGRMVASGLGIRDRDYVGLYAIYVAPSCRRRHYARAICSTILGEAKQRGAKKAYLQVVKGNASAKSLYTSLGFADFYTYWFRSKSSV
ncbi:MAG: GNAT family N-acetyltransferase [Lachnospiraceae bacterium]|nr:GNAT family N-acetyltransferase [Lachnospiraceae bacterium]